jgi:zinc/manganese transport system permease protein
VHTIYTAIFEPGFFASPLVHVAVTIGGAVAVICGVSGVFTVMRGQSFAGHALGDVAGAGGSGALLAGLAPVAGFAGLGVIGAAAMDLIGVQRVRSRDLATGIVLGAAIGLSALFLYLTSVTGAITGAVQQILFGSIFTTSSSTIPAVILLGGIAVAGVAAICRPLLLITVSPDIAASRGVPVRLVGAAYMVTLALAVGLSSLATGAILSTALLIGPAATALRLTRTVAGGLGLACLIGVLATWLGVLLAYDSYDWGHRRALPVSFCIVAVIFAGYLAAALPTARSAGRRRSGLRASTSEREKVPA